MDGFRGVFGFKEEELGDDDVGGVVVDGSVNADDRSCCRGDTSICFTYKLVI